MFARGLPESGMGEGKGQRRFLPPSQVKFGQRKKPVGSSNLFMRNQYNKNGMFK